MFSEKDIKILRNHHLRFVLYSNGQIYGGDFAKLCGLLRIYELYHIVAPAWASPRAKPDGRS